MIFKFLKVSNWSLFLLKRFKFALSVKSRLTSLEGVPHVSSSNFLFWFLIFDFFFKNQKICHVSSCHRATWQWQSDVTVTVTRVSIMSSVILLVSIWSLYFNFYLNLVSFFVKINNFVPLQIEIKFNFYINVHKYFHQNWYFK